MNWIVDKPIAHRGLHGGAIHENSMESFENAIRNGYPIELDVRQLSDGNLVVFHDGELERMTGFEGRVAEQDINGIKKLRLKGSDQHIPAFEEVLDLVGGDVPLLVETKNKHKAGCLEETVWKNLADYKGDYAIQSFNPRSVAWFKNNAPAVMRGQLSGDFRDEKDLERYKIFVLKRLMMNWSCSPHFIAYDIRCLPYWIATLWRKKGVPLLAWTVKSMEEKRKALEFADNYIFENIAMR